MPPFQSKSVRFTGRLNLSGPIEKIFPLFSPLGEKSWVPGWEPELLHPAGASWEQGQIFRTHEATGDAVWVVTRLDRAGHAVEYHRVEPGRYVARVEVRCAAASRDATTVSVSYEFIGLSEGGNAEIAAMSDADYAQKMERWSRWIGGYLASGAA